MAGRRHPAARTGTAVRAAVRLAGWPTVEGTEVRKLAALEDAHWWYRERRHLLAGALRGMTPGRALDVGRGRRRQHPRAARRRLVGRGPGVRRGRRRRSPPSAGCRCCGPTRRCCRSPTASLDLVVAFDVLEHLVDDDACGRPTSTRAAARRHLPGGRSLRPAAVVRARRGGRPRAALHPRDAAATCCERGGFEVESMHLVERPAAPRRGACGAASSSRQRPRRTCTRWSTSGCGAVIDRRALPAGAPRCPASRFS